MDNQIKPANRALYLTVAVVIMVLAVVGAVVWVGTGRGGDSSSTLVAGIIAFVAPVVTAILAMLAALDVDNKTTQIDRKVNGVISKAIDDKTAAQAEVHELRNRLDANGS